MPEQQPPGASSRRIERVSAPVRDQAVAAIRDEIISGRAWPGKRLIEREICEELGISRATAREALRLLDSEGLVTVVPGRGPEVARISEQDMRELYEVRRALETLAVRLFIERATDAEVAELRAAVAALGEAYETDEDIADVLRCKDQFYDVLYGGARNSILKNQAANLHTRLTRLRVTSLGRPGRATQSFDEVVGIVDAIDARSADLAVARTEAHVLNAWRAATGPVSIAAEA